MSDELPRAHNGCTCDCHRIPGITHIVACCYPKGEEHTRCAECGMVCASGEYHPYAACLMFKACHNSETVRANLDFVLNTIPDSKPYKWKDAPDAYESYDEHTRKKIVCGFRVGFNAARERKEG